MARLVPVSPFPLLLFPVSPPAVALDRSIHLHAATARVPLPDPQRLGARPCPLAPSAPSALTGSPFELIADYDAYRA